MVSFFDFYSVLFGLFIGFLGTIGLFWGNEAAKKKLKNGSKYTLLESFKTELDSSFVLLKLGNDLHFGSNLYLIESYKIRDCYLKIMSQDKIPETFKVKKLKTLLPERFPSYIKDEVYVLIPIS
jgi:hypothetical protein